MLAAKKLSPGIYTDSSWITDVSVIDEAEFKKNYQPAYTTEYNVSVECLRQFRMYVTDISIAQDKLYKHYAGDGSFFFNHLLNDACEAEKGTITWKPLKQSGKYIQLRSADLNYRFPTIFTSNKNYFVNGLIFWLLLAAGLIAFAFVIYSIIKKLFSLHIPDLSVWKLLDDKIISNAKLNNLVFVIGLPGAGKKYHIINKIQKGELQPDNKEDGPFIYDEKDDSNNNVFIADLINIPDASDNSTDANKHWEEFMRRVFSKKHRLIIINHFEYNIQDPLTNRRKLNLLERLMLDNNVKIFILSTIHPVAFLDSVIAQVVKKEGFTGIPGEDLERWHVLLGHFRIVLLPLDLEIYRLKKNDRLLMIEGSVQCSEGKPIAGANISFKHTKEKDEKEKTANEEIEKTGDENIVYETVTGKDGKFQLNTLYALPLTLLVKAKGYISENILISNYDKEKPLLIKMDEAYYNWKDRIRAETNYTHFLKAMQQPAIDISGALPEKERMHRSDELAFKLQVTSHYFYMYIWQSLTKEEKFLLYDLAEDNLVNSIDNYNLTMLIAKGVIVRTDGTLRLFNKGFRNFILTAIGNTEAEKIKTQMKDNGNWSKLKNPLLIVVLAILTFLLASQEESYSKVLTYLAALSAGIPTVLKLFSFFEKSTNKSD